ncbi:MAG: putative transrane anti-sigma factor, partial [Gemmatimonadales bacterium]|nr:putative transrane anti-sigma factor [Gemmatimonadales bacterium]
DLGAAMREALPIYDAPPSLQAWARDEARKLDEESLPLSEPPTRPPISRMGRLSQWPIAAGLVIAAAAGWGAGFLRPAGGITSPTNAMTAQIVDAHVRSLLPGHLLDVESSDRHTVKPWFAGKTDIAPVVVDLADKGFPLLGGRLDYVDGHTAAALAYGRRGHTINLFIGRSTPGEPRDGSFSVRGYSVLHWSNGGLSAWAVSDAALSELEAFRDAYVRP